MKFIKQNNQSTMAIYFDLEYYVPTIDRDTNFRLKADPTRDDHLLLGGVFYNGDLGEIYQSKKGQSLWIWNMKSFDTNNPKQAEKKLLEIISKIFHGELQTNPPLKRVGINISSSDLPYLFIRSQHHNIASNSQLYRSYFSGFNIDLSQAGIGFVDDLPYGFEPVPSNTLFGQWGLSDNKGSGSSVWELYDSSDFHLIEHRTMQEVEKIIQIYHILQRETE